MPRVYNFSAGPAALPLDVLEQAQSEMLDYSGTGMSVMEMSHRSKDFIEIAERAETSLRLLYAIPDDYAVLFLPGGASLQFAMVPLNLAGQGDSVDYALTGHWSQKAFDEASIAASAHPVVTATTSIPGFEKWDYSTDAKYLHITSNETISGVEFHDFPSDAPAPLVVDMSSDFLSRPIDIERFGLIYAGAQKNAGAAGITIVIVRKDLCVCPRADLPKIFRYQSHIEKQSMFNTPPTYSWYLTGLVFDWILSQGGVEAMEDRAKRKARKLYGFIDNSNAYTSVVDEAARSLMNVSFSIVNPALTDAFVREADDFGLYNLKGHRSVGGLRASIYNAVPEKAVDELIGFMQIFESKYASQLQ